MKNLKLITEHKDYLLFVSTREIQLGDNIVSGNVELKFGWNWGVHLVTKDNIKAFKETQGLMRRLSNEKTKNVITEPIIAHLPLNDAPKLEGVPLLPELPKQKEDWNKLYWTKDLGEWEKYSFQAGYKAASKKWSDEDMLKSFQAGIEAIKNLRSEDPSHALEVDYWNSFITDISFKLTPTGFEPELHWKDTLLPHKDLTKRQYNIIDGVLQGTYKF